MATATKTMAISPAPLEHKSGSENDDGLLLRAFIGLCRSRFAKAVGFVALVFLAGVISWQLSWSRGHENGCESMRTAAKANGIDFTAGAAKGADEIKIEGCTFKLPKPTPTTPTAQ